MLDERRPLRDLVGKMIVTKEGKRLGFVQDLTFETKTGELIHLVVKNPTPYSMNLNLERTNKGDLLIPHNSIMAISDFVVISEEDLV